MLCDAGTERSRLASAFMITLWALFFLWWILFENENQNSEKDLIKIVEDILLKKVMQILMKEAKRNLKRGLAF